MSVSMMKIPTKEDPRWQHVVKHDANADGRFVYAVKTTRVYCRPSCPSRTAKPENVSFFASPSAAEAAGFRPCLRCNPAGQSLDQLNGQLVAEACQIIEVADPPPTLDELAAQIGVSTSHFHRLFKTATGLTPKQWAAAHRANKLRTALSVPESRVTDAIYAAGFNASSRFYEQSNKRLGMTPTNYRAGGKDADIRFAVAQCKLGAIMVAQSDKGICAIALGDDPEALVQEVQDRFPHANLIGGDPDFEQLVAKVIGFVETPQIGLELPLDIRGTAFQERVWQALLRIPPGKTMSYSDIAISLGAPKSARAVAQACAANVIAVAIPCHRVVRNDGAISGYRWGIDRKRALLAIEASA